MYLNDKNKNELFFTGAFFAAVTFLVVFAALFCFLAAIDKGQEGTIKIRFVAVTRFEVLYHTVNVNNLRFHNNTSNAVSNF